MSKRRRRYYDSYMTVKSHQNITKRITSVVHKWDVEELELNIRESVVNKRRRSRVGHIETVREK